MDKSLSDDDQSALPNTLSEIDDLEFEQRISAARRGRRRYRWMRLVFLWMLIVLMMLIFAAVARLCGSDIWPGIRIVGAWGVLVVVVGARWVSESERLDKIIASFQGSNDPRIIGMVIDELEDSDYTYARSVDARVFHILDGVHQGSGTALSDRHQTFLWRRYLLIRSKLAPHEAARIACLVRAMAAIGDETSLSTIKRIAECRQYEKYHKPLKLLAQDLLPEMEERLGMREVSDTLLRATSLPEPPDELLRPVSDLQLRTANKVELLRSTIVNTGVGEPTESEIA